MRKLFLLCLILLALMTLSPTYAVNDDNSAFNTASCHLDWEVNQARPSPRSLSDYIWGVYQSDLIARFPQLSPDAGKPYSQLLRDMIQSNTPLAIQLDNDYNWGFGTASGGVQPYSVLWDSWDWGQFANLLMNYNRLTTPELYSCLHDYYDFDTQFTIASINLSHTFVSYDHAGYVDATTAFDLDPKVYGEKPVVISVQEPGFIPRRDGHVVLSPGGCDLGALYYYDNETNYPNLIGRESVEGCYGTKYILLIVPQAVAEKVGPWVTGHVQGFLTILWGGNGDPALPHVLTGEDGDKTFVAKLQKLGASNWPDWQQAYRTLMSALNDYSKTSGLNYNFTRYTRFPYDTRLPSDVERKLIQESFPSPLEELMPAFVGGNITLASLRACVAGRPGCPTWDGNAFARSYAQLVYSYLSKYGSFTWTQSITRRWLSNYYSVDSLPDFDVKTVYRTWLNVPCPPGGTPYQNFQYQDALSSFSQPTSIGFSTILSVTPTSMPSTITSSPLGPQAIPSPIITANNSTLTNATTITTTSETIPTNNTLPQNLPPAQIESAIAIGNQPSWLETVVLSIIVAGSVSVTTQLTFNHRRHRELTPPEHGAFISRTLEPDQTRKRLQNLMSA